MSSNRRFPFVAGLLLSLLLACGGQAEPSPALYLDTLMSQLGDASFTVRDRAARRLRERAWEVREQLLAGLLVSDPEIRWQCRRLWPEVEERYLQELVAAWDASRACGLAEWPRYRKLLGETKEARELFASMHRAEPELLVALSRQSGEGAEKDGARALRKEPVPGKVRPWQPVPPRPCFMRDSMPGGRSLPRETPRWPSDPLSPRSPSCR